MDDRTARLVGLLFTHPAPPQETQPIRIEKIREKARELALLIAEEAPSGPEQTLALRRLSEARWYAGLAIQSEEVPR